MQILKDFLVLDTETTGMEEHDQVVELAILDEHGRTLYHSLFKPDVPMNPFARRKNNISDAMMEHAPRFMDEWAKIRAILQNRRVLGHNIAEFDVQLIRQTLEAQNAAPDCMDGVLDTVLDSLAMARRMGFKRASQEALAQHYGLPEEKHRAVEDCQQLLQVMEHLEKEFLTNALDAALAPGKSKSIRVASAQSETEASGSYGQKKEERVFECSELCRQGTSFNELVAHFGFRQSTIAEYLGLCVGSKLLGFRTAVQMLAQPDGGDGDIATLRQWQKAVFIAAHAMRKNNDNLPTMPAYTAIEELTGNFEYVVPFTRGIEMASPNFCAQLQQKYFENNPAARDKIPTIRVVEATPESQKTGMRDRDQRVAECLTLVSEGKTIQEMSEYFGYAASTVASYLGTLVATERLDMDTAIDRIMQFHNGNDLAVWREHALGMARIHAQTLEEPKGAQWKAMCQGSPEIFQLLASFVQNVERLSQGCCEAHLARAETIRPMP